MTKPPFDVRDTDHIWIEMSDGTRLAARLWQPDTDRPVPAILEYIPYRKADMVRARDERNHPFFAAHGYACIRIDMRGSGDSEGHMPDMYAHAELDDARQVIEWLADQPWCNGRVGMFGTSWGGTAALQAGVDAPAALKTVIAVCATHDRFEDDIHYMGGCVLTDTFEWGATLPAILASPPTPHAGAHWKALWRARIEALTCPLENWLAHNGRGAYWRHGSVIHQVDRMRVPVLAVGGWSDRYSNSVMTLVDARPDLVWGVVGPWGHHYPDHAAPGPGVGFQRLALDWWDHHLRAEPETEFKAPRLRVWQRTFDAPADSIERRAGRWIESGPPAAETDKITWTLQDMASTQGPWSIPDDPNIGTTSGDTGYFGRAGGLPLDQSPDDARSVVFESDPLPTDLALYGALRLAIKGRVAQGAAKVVVRVSDVAPDGTACRITYGVRNLALDDSLDHPRAEVQSGLFDVSIPLHSTAYKLQKGHRLRIAISTALWPLIWSSASGAVEIEAGELFLPELRRGDHSLSAALPPTEDLPAVKSHDVLAAPALKRWSENSETRSEIGWHQPKTAVAYRQIGTVFAYETRMVHQQDRSDGLWNRVTVDHTMEFERPDGTAQISARLTANGQNGDVTVRVSVAATWNNESIAARVWDIPATPVR